VSRAGKLGLQGVQRRAGRGWAATAGGQGCVTPSRMCTVRQALVASADAAQLPMMGASCRARVCRASAGWPPAGVPGLGGAFRSDRIAVPPCMHGVLMPTAAVADGHVRWTCGAGPHHTPPHAPCPGTPRCLSPLLCGRARPLADPTRMQPAWSHLCCMHSDAFTPGCRAACPSPTSVALAHQAGLVHCTQAARRGTCPSKRGCQAGQGNSCSDKSLDRHG
jgi:hypothetical protein